MTPPGPLTPEEALAKLVTEYGNLSFECGEYDFGEDGSGTDGYRLLYERTKAARARLLAALQSAARLAPVTARLRAEHEGPEPCAVCREADAALADFATHYQADPPPARPEEAP